MKAIDLFWFSSRLKQSLTRSWAQGVHLRGDPRTQKLDSKESNNGRIKVNKVYIDGSCGELTRVACRGVSKESYRMYFIKFPSRGQKGWYLSSMACSQGVTLHSSMVGLHVVLRQPSRDPLMLDAGNEHGAINHIGTEIRPREYAPVHSKFLL